MTLAAYVDQATASLSAGSGRSIGLRGALPSLAPLGALVSGGCFTRAAAIVSWHGFCIGRQLGATTPEGNGGSATTLTFSNCAMSMYRSMWSLHCPMRCYGGAELPAGSTAPVECTKLPL